MPPPSAHTFPVTNRTWIHESLAGGEDARKALWRQLMDLYNWPLQAHVSATALGAYGEPADLVNGFFADRLVANGYLEAWQASGKRLRTWLANGLWFYARERRRSERRHLGTGASLDDLPDQQPDVGVALDRAFAHTVTQLAIEQAERECESDGLANHWTCFLAHHCHGRPYRELAESLGVTAGRAAVMARTASTRFRAAVRRLVELDGIERHRVDRAIQAIVDSLQT